MTSSSQAKKKLATSQKREVRMLTQSEIESLQRDKEISGAWLMAKFREDRLKKEQATKA